MKRQRNYRGRSVSTGRVRSLVENLETRVLFSTYTVTSLADGNGIVSAAPGGNFNATTLRAAINASNSHAGADIIKFATNLSGTVALGSSDLPDINDTLTVNGPGATKIAIHRLGVKAGKTVIINSVKLLAGFSGPPSFNPSLCLANAGNLTVQNSVVTGGQLRDIANTGTLTLYNTTVSNGQVDGGGGGLINSGTAIILNSFFTGNVSGPGQGGGAIYNSGKLTVANTTFSSNFADLGNGGGIFNKAGATATVVGCTFNGNNATNAGGAIENNGVLTLSDSTITGNTTLGPGGAIENTGTAVVTNCTITANKSNSDVGGISTTSGLTLKNTIVVGNLQGNSTAANIDGNVNAASSFNIVGTGGTGGLVNGVAGNKTNVAVASLKLGALASNGGPTKTIALLSGSIAINAGSNSNASAAKLFADQRGITRVSGGTVDVGAFEVQASTGASIAGTFYADTNKDGVHQSGEPVLTSWFAYLDQNLNGVYDPGEIMAFGSTGAFKFTNLAAGTDRVYEYRQAGWNRTKPAPTPYYSVTLASNTAAVGKDFLNYLI